MAQGMTTLPLIVLCSECCGPQPCECMRRFGYVPRPLPRWRSRLFLSWVRSLPCSVPDCTGGPIEAAHFGPRAAGRKVHDSLAIPLCERHHREHHANGRAWEHYGDVLRWQVQTLVAALASGENF